MTKDIIYLRHILEALRRIRAYAGGDKSEFMNNAMVQDACIRNLEIVGEATKRLSPDFRDRETEIPWNRIAGMRDVLIHGYMGVDLEIVWDVIANRLEDIELRIGRLVENDD